MREVEWEFFPSFRRFQFCVLLCFKPVYLQDEIAEVKNTNIWVLPKISK